MAISTAFFRGDFRCGQTQLRGQGGESRESTVAGIVPPDYTEPEEVLEDVEIIMRSYGLCMMDQIGSYLALGFHV